MKTSERVAEVYARRFGRAPTGIACAPGRVNLLGEHVDYNDGFVLPMAADRFTYVAYGSVDTVEHVIWADDLQEEIRFDPQILADDVMTSTQSLPQWGRYPAGVAWSLIQAGQQVPPIHAVLASDVPRGAGLSSSASVEVAFALAWLQLAGGAMPCLDLARICQRAENDFVGVRCGIMDQVASACSEPGRVIVLDCRSLDYHTLPLPPGVSVIVADSGVRHALADGAYNDRRAACERAVEILKAARPEIQALRDVSPQDLDSLAEKLPPEVHIRARHVVEEIDRTRRAVSLLRDGNLKDFGALMNQSHASLRDLYEVSCPELETLARVARGLPGCYGARLTGAGFGGSTVNLVQEREANTFVEALGAVYERAHGKKAAMYICHAADGAHML